MAETKKQAETSEVVARKKSAQTIRGFVTSDKMNKTRVVVVKRRIKHGLYHKAVIKHSKFFIHDEKNESKTGDLVLAVGVRRLSKNKAFRLFKILEKGA